MRQVRAKRLAAIAATLQWDRGRWIWLLLLTLPRDLVMAFGDSSSALLRYDRGGIAAGGWWRLLTAHLVHLDAHHLVLNELGLVLVWALFADDYAALEWGIIAATAALAISSGLWWLSPGIEWYVGASGVLHAAMAAGVARHLARRSWDRWLLLFALCAKLAQEHWLQRPASWVVSDAHLYGAAAGFAVGAALSMHIAIIRLRSNPQEGR